MRSRDPLAGLSVFIAVTETLNFSKAAELLGLSKATVSTQLTDLESRLGVRLLHRNNRSVVLTEAGAAYRDALTGLVPQAKMAESEAKSFQEGRVGTIRMSVSPDLGQQYLSAIVARFLTNNPEINVTMDFSLEPVDLVERGFDVAIRGEMKMSDTLIIRRLASCGLILCASPGYLMNAEAISRPEDLTKHSCLHFSPLWWGRSWHFSRNGESETFVPISPRLETNDSISLCAAAKADAGVALLPEYVVQDDIQQGLLVQPLPEWKSADVPIHAVYPANRHIAVKVRHFVSVLAKELAAAFGGN